MKEVGSDGVMMKPELDRVFHIGCLVEERTRFEIMAGLQDGTVYWVGAKLAMRPMAVDHGMAMKWYRYSHDTKEKEVMLPEVSVLL